MTNQTTTETHVCEHDDCNEPGIGVYLSPSDDPDAYYCYGHMRYAGFCTGCLYFFAGIESFDFPGPHGNIPGYCSECSDEVRGEIDGFDDPEDGFWDEYAMSWYDPGAPELSNGEDATHHTIQPDTSESPNIYPDPAFGRDAITPPREDTVEQGNDDKQ